MNMIIRTLLLAGLLPALAVAAPAMPRCVVDDLQREVCVAAPAQRIVSLSPGATELLFDAGAGEQVVGAVSFSDYPPAANAIPRVGSYNRLDLETLLTLRPDLVIAWRSGNPREQVDQLVRLGIPVYHTEPRRFADITSTLYRLARLAGTEQTGDAAGDAFGHAVQALRQQYQDADPVTLFYQIWNDPLMTVNATHFISEAMRLCGGVNVFGELSRLTPTLDIEAVLAANPQAIVAGGMGEDDHGWVEAWRRYPELQAVRKDHLFFIPPSTLQRPTVRLLTGTRTLCGQLQAVRDAD